MEEPLSPDEVKAKYYKYSKGKQVKVVNYDDIIHAEDLSQFFTEESPCIVIFYPAIKEGNMTVNNIKGTNHEISIIVGAFSVCIFLFSGFAAWKNKKTINRRRPAQIKTPS